MNNTPPEVLESNDPSVTRNMVVSEPGNRQRVTDQEVAKVKLPSGRTVSRSQYNSWFRFRAR